MRVLILGSSGWIAHYLIPELKKDGIEILGVSNTQKPQYGIDNLQFDINKRKFSDEVRKIKYDFIVNMLHSKDYERSQTINKELSSYCKDKGVHYAFLSSANALDGDPSKPHEENELANGGSDYGKYKAKCEEFLYKNHPEACIIRFPAGPWVCP